MNAHFFDLDTLIQSDGKVWIIDRVYPNQPIMRISKSDYALIIKGIYSSNGEKVKFSDKNYFISKDFYKQLQINCKKTKTDIGSLAFSMQEFLNKEIIEELDFRINLDIMIKLKNTTDDIYIICARNTKNNYEKYIKKLEEKILQEGLKIKDYYFITETFFNKSEDNISHKKVRLLLQHLIGLKTDVDKFTDKELIEYDEVFFYEDDLSTIETTKRYQEILLFLLSNTESNLSSSIREKLKKTEKILHLNLITPNKVNQFIKTIITVKLPNIAKTFESFKFSKWRC